MVDILSWMVEQVEYVTLVNEQGESQETIPRSEAKRRREELLASGKYMPVVGAVVLNGLGQILVHRRGIGGHTADVRNGVLDNIYGGLPANMHPDEAVRKESLEETGATIDGILHLVSTGINANKFYRYFYVGTTSVTTEQLQGLELGTPEETTWVGFLPPQELYEKQQSGTEQFTGSFFEDLEAARQFLANTS